MFEETSDMQVNIGSNWRCSCLSKRWQFDYLRTRLYCRAKFYSTICQQGEENIPTNCQLDTHTVANIHDNCNKENNISLLKRVVNISTLVGKVPDSVTNGWCYYPHMCNISISNPPIFNQQKFYCRLCLRFCDKTERHLFFCWWGLRAWYWRWWHLS